MKELLVRKYAGVDLEPPALIEDHRNKKYGRWRCVAFVGRNDKKVPLWRFKCKCGTVVISTGTHMRSGKSTSCGCLLGAVVAARNMTHGLAYAHPLYALWKGIHARCRDEKHTQYRDYGSRGIKVCARWSGYDGFANFIADMGERPSGRHTIDRKNNDGNYEPTNCEWSTRKQNARNTRSNRLIAAFSRVQCLAAWAEEYGLAYGALQYRLDNDWDVEAALTTPSRRKR